MRPCLHRFSRSTVRNMGPTRNEALARESPTPNADTMTKRSTPDVLADAMTALFTPSVLPRPVPAGLLPRRGAAAGLRWTSGSSLPRVCMVVPLGRDRLPPGRGHESRGDIPAVRVPGHEYGEAARSTLPGAALTRARVVVFQRRPAVGGWRTAPGAARRVRNQGGGGRGAGGTHSPAEPGAGADDGGLAGPVAGVAGVAARVDRPELRGARAR